MKTLIILMVLVPMLASAAAAQTEKCFRYVDGEIEHQLNLTIDGRSVKGSLIVSRVNSEAPSRVYEFTGTATKTQITLRFADAKVPDVFPKRGERLTGQFLAGGSLELRLSSLVHDRGWRDVHTAVYRPCG